MERTNHTHISRFDCVIMKRPTKFKLVLFSLILALAGSPILSQQGSRAFGGNLRDDREVRAAFQSVVATADAATVRIVCNGREAALGTVVGSDGWIITKYSELREPVVCRFISGRQLPANVVGYDPQYDLAMLKIDATGLKTVQWANDAAGPAVGQLLATASPGELPRAIGVVSVPERAIPTHLPRPKAQLGISFDMSEKDDKPKIARVLPDSPADKAGLKMDDVVIQLNGKPVESCDKLVTYIRQCNPGDQAELLVKRGDDEIKVTATLKKPDGSGAVTRSDRMNEMGGPLSYRSSSFPSVIQHDTVLRPADCGGPLVDLSGKVVGINIARAGRTESYAAPADQVRRLLTDMESGRMAPKDTLPGTKEMKTSTPQPESKKEEAKNASS
jgi:serine protease Do